MIRRIFFITGTRADFGKLKPLIKAMQNDKELEPYIFVTGMHMYPKYGFTGEEVAGCGFKNIFNYINQKPNDSMDTILANTILGLSNYLVIQKPDMVVIHGDRVEALAGAIVGALNNIIVAHIEGGEISGTIDESIRHAVSKLAHLHFVSNNQAKKRLLQMGESERNIYVIGSPDIDLMLSPDLISISEVKRHYDIPFKRYAILAYHPVTTSLHALIKNTRELLKAVIDSGENYVVIYPNNDPGADIILEEYAMLKNNSQLRIFPSIRFEYFLTLLKNCEFIIGNSSAGIREAPFYAVPTINVGSRQKGRFSYETIIDVDDSAEAILAAVGRVKKVKGVSSNHFGDGKSSEKFLKVLREDQTWNVTIQKFFMDRV